MHCHQGTNQVDQTYQIGTYSLQWRIYGGKNHNREHVICKQSSTRQKWMSSY